MERLKDLRRKNGVSLKELAFFLCVKPSTISYYEKGSRNPSFKHLIELSNYFNVSINYLCGIDLENEEDIEKLNVLLNKHPQVYEYLCKDIRNSIIKLEKYVKEKELLIK